QIWAPLVPSVQAHAVLAPGMHVLPGADAEHAAATPTRTTATMHRLLIAPPGLPHARTFREAPPLGFVELRYDCSWLRGVVSRIVWACLRQEPRLLLPSAMMIGLWAAGLALTQMGLRALGPLFRLWLFSAVYLLLAGVVIGFATLVAMGAAAALA